MSGSAAHTVFEVVSFSRLSSESAMIHMLSGDLQVELNKEREIIQSGPAEKKVSCYFDYNLA